MMKLSNMQRVVDTVVENDKSHLAEEIGRYWGCDEGTIEYIRSSANHIFSFKKDGERYFLRFNHSDERDGKSISEEIKLLVYLNNKSCNTVKPVKSLNNKYVETVTTEMGVYHSVVFEALQGNQFEIEDIDTKQFYQWGKALGSLHRITNEIPKEANIKRDSWKEDLYFIENNLPKDEINVKEELKKVKEWAVSLKVSSENYGLIHFDFELDNLCWRGETIEVLDFDDCCYYWYVADIAFALRDLYDDKINFKDENFKEFIKGYESEFKIDTELLKDLSWFMRLHNLLVFAKLQRSVDIHKVSTGSAWLFDLREKLLGKMEQYRRELKFKNIKIRLEERNDWSEVELLTRKAFWRDERIEKIGVGATEHYMVHMMRGNEGIKELTFVAEIEGKIVGHIIYSNGSYISLADGNKKKVLNFGPLSVLPEYQKQGIGSALMHHSIMHAKALGYGAILFFGHPTYYPRFGFKEAKEFGITTESGNNFSAFMAMELLEGYLKGIEGKYIEAPIYHEDITKLAAKEYDKRFLTGTSL